VTVSRSIPRLEGNVSTISLAHSHANRKCSKYVGTGNYSCREPATMGHIAVRYIGTDEQAADNLIKPWGHKTGKKF
jgi:hypothetical protein